MVSAALRSSPLNVMIMTEGCENQFVQLKEQLELCVGVNHYTIYPLPSTNYASPWQGNCRAIVIPPNVLTNNWNVLDSYIKDGGCVISFNSQWNQLNGFPYPSSATANSITSIRLCLDDSPEPFQAIALSNEAIEGQRGSVTADGVEVLAEAVLDKQSNVAMVIGKETMMMSYIDMMSSHDDCTDADVLASLKRDVMPRRRALRRLLSKAGIKCGEVAPPSLSLCYLLASDKVCFCNNELFIWHHLLRFGWTSFHS